jgi:hypothetical protein
VLSGDQAATTIITEPAARPSLTQEAHRSATRAGDGRTSGAGIPRGVPGQYSVREKVSSASNGIESEVAIDLIPQVFTAPCSALTTA